MSGNTEIWISRPTVSCPKCTWWDILSGRAKRAPIPHQCSFAGDSSCEFSREEGAPVFVTLRLQRELFCSANSPLPRASWQNTVTPFCQGSLSAEVCCHLMEALVILCGHAYLTRIYTKPCFAECDESKTVNVPLLNVLCSLFPSCCVQLGELLFPFKFGEVFCWGFLRFRVAGALLALHHFIIIFSKQSFFPSVNQAPPRQYLKHSFVFVPMKCICALRSQLSLMWPGFEQLLLLVFQL